MTASSVTVIDVTFLKAVQSELPELYHIKSRSSKGPFLSPFFYLAKEKVATSINCISI